MRGICIFKSEMNCQAQARFAGALPLFAWPPCRLRHYLFPLMPQGYRGRYNTPGIACLQVRFLLSSICRNHSAQQILPTIFLQKSCSIFPREFFRKLSGYTFCCLCRQLVKCFFDFLVWVDYKLSRQALLFAQFFHYGFVRHETPSFLSSIISRRPLKSQYPVQNRRSAQLPRPPEAVTPPRRGIGGGTSLRDIFITRPRRELPPREEAWGIG